MNTGRAMRAFTGICARGTRPQMLQVRMKVNSVMRNGVIHRDLSPSGPIVWRTIPSSTKSTADSATFWMPVGTRAFLRPPSHITPMAISVENHIRTTTLLMPRGPTGHSTTWEMGGNSNPRIIRRRPPCRWWA